jgi:carbon monoxide dehydrogenase subunit G
MRFEEEIRVPVSLDEAWDFLWQTERLAACLPGCKSVEEVEPQKSYKAQVEDRVGLFSVRFDLDVVVQEMKPREYVRLLSTGQDRRLGATQKVVLDVRLKEVGPEETLLGVDADVEILGKIATLGQFVVKRKVKEIVGRFTENVKKELDRRA